MTDDRNELRQNAALDFSGVLPGSDVHRFAQNIFSPQQAQQHYFHQQQLLSHYAAMAVAQQSLHRVGAHAFMDANALDVHHRSPLYPDFYHHPAQPQQPTPVPAKKPFYSNSLLSDSALSKYAPLGNLCKTVSQIGQSPSTPPAPLNGTKLASPVNSETTPNKKSLKRPLSLSENASTNGETKTPTAAKSSDTSNATKNTRLETMDSGMESSDDAKSETSSNKDENGSQMWPAWIYCTRYSDRPSSGPRYRKPKTPKVKGDNDEKRPRTAFSSEQLARLKVDIYSNIFLI